MEGGRGRGKGSKMQNGRGTIATSVTYPPHALVKTPLPVFCVCARFKYISYVASCVLCVRLNGQIGDGLLGGCLALLKGEGGRGISVARWNFHPHQKSQNTTIISIATAMTILVKERRKEEKVHV